MIGDRGGALAAFERVGLGFGDDHELMLQLGRALSRGAREAHRFFESGVGASRFAGGRGLLGYASHRLGIDADACTGCAARWSSTATYAEARIYLANILYDRGESEAALYHFDRTEPEDHFDELGIWRYDRAEEGALSAWRTTTPSCSPWLARLAEVGGEPDSIDMLLAEIEAHAAGRIAARPQPARALRHAARRPPGHAEAPDVGEAHP